MNINVEPSLSIEGWMTEAELTYLASVASRSSMIVEVGSWKGRTTRTLATHTTGLVMAVDTWGGSIAFEPSLRIDSDVFNEFSENLRGLRNVWPIPCTSLHAASLLTRVGARFDLIFLDADHEYESVRDDINAWMPLLSPGGILCGHDYTAPPHPGVKQAVDELVGAVNIIDTIWTTEDLG